MFTMPSQISSIGGFVFAAIAFILVVAALTPRIPPASRSEPPSTRCRLGRDQAMKSPIGLLLKLLALTENLGRLMPGRLRDHLESVYRQAGWPGGLTSCELASVTLMCSFSGMLLGSALGSLGGPLLTYSFLFAGPVLAHLGVLGLLRSVASQRRLSIIRDTPLAAEWIALLTHSGLALRNALGRVADSFQARPFGEELRFTLSETDRNQPLTESLNALSSRLQIGEIRQLTQILAQSHTAGTNPTESLRDLSSRLYGERARRATTAAGRARGLIALPVTLLTVGVLLLVMGPFVLKLASGSSSFGLTP